MDDSSSTGRWLTYDELATLRGIKRIGAVRLVQRHKWRRQAGNDSLARVLVPHDALEPVRRIAAGSSTPTMDAGTSADHNPPTNAGTGAGNVAILLAAQLEQANERADEANRRADAAVALVDRTLIQLSEAEKRGEAERSRADRAEQTIATERSRADALREQLETVQAEASDARKHANEAQQTVEALRRELETAHITQADAEADVTEMRRAEEERKARGRWARLKAAWRGE